VRGVGWWVVGGSPTYVLLVPLLISSDLVNTLKNSVEMRLVSLTVSLGVLQ